MSSIHRQFNENGSNGNENGNVINGNVVNGNVITHNNDKEGFHQTGKHKRRQWYLDNIKGNTNKGSNMSKGGNNKGRKGAKGKTKRSIEKERKERSMQISSLIRQSFDSPYALLTLYTTTPSSNFDPYNLTSLLLRLSQLPKEKRIQAKESPAFKELIRDVSTRITTTPTSLRTLRRLHPKTLSRYDTFTTKDLSYLTHSISVLCGEGASMDYEVHGFIYGIFRHVDHVAAGFLRDEGNDVVDGNIARHCAMYVAACGRLGYGCDNFVRVMEERGGRWFRDNSSGGDLGALMWGLGNMGMGEGIVRDIVGLKDGGRHIWRRLILEDCRVREASVTVWAMGKVGYPECKKDWGDTVGGLLEGDKEVREKVWRDGRVSNIAGYFWAAGKVGVQCEEWFKEIERRDSSVQKKVLHNATPGEIGQILWSSLAHSVELKNFYAAVDECWGRISMRNGGRKGDPKHAGEGKLAVASTHNPYVMVAFIYAKMGREGRNVFEEMCKRIESFDKFEERDLANALWALAVGGYVKKKEDVFLKLWSLATGAEKELDYTMEECAQLYHARMIAEAEGLDLPESRADVFVRMEESVVELMSYNENNDGVSHGDGRGVKNWGGREDCIEAISEILNRKGFVHEKDVSPGDKKDGFLTINFAGTEEKIAVELHWGNHFTWRTSPTSSNHSTIKLRSLVGSKKSKVKLLEKLGWRVVSIDFMELQQCETREDGEEMILGKLKEQAGWEPEKEPENEIDIKIANAREDGDLWVER